jgi:hypothetical protein
MVVEDDLEALRAGEGYDPVEDFEGVEALEIGVDGAAGVVEGDSGGDGGGFDHLVGEGQADGVVAAAPDDGDDGFVVLDSETAGNCVGGLESVPVDSGDADGAVGGVEELAAAGVPETVAETRLHCGGRMQSEDYPEEEHSIAGLDEAGEHIHPSAPHPWESLGTTIRQMMRQRLAQRSLMS